MKIVLGKDLKVGDVISVWWKPNRDMIVELKPYKGLLTSVLGENAKIAIFGINVLGMTIEPEMMYEVITSS